MCGSSIRPGPGVAASGLVRVSNVPACRPAAGGLPWAWGAAGAAAVSGAAFAVHGVVGTAGHRRARRLWRGRRRAVADQLGRGVGPMERAVARGLTAKPVAAPAHLGVDERSAGRGQDYLTAR